MAARKGKRSRKGSSPRSKSKPSKSAQNSLKSRQRKHPSASKRRTSSKKRDYKAEYKRRIKAGRKKGLTRQQARGHKAKEHVERRKREGLTSKQTAEVKSFYETEYNPGGLDQRARADYDQVIAWVEEHGVRKFQQWRKTWREIKDTYDGSNSLYQEEQLEDFIDTFEAPDVTWLYYH